MTGIDDTIEPPDGICYFINPSAIFHEWVGWVNADLNDEPDPPPVEASVRLWGFTLPLDRTRHGVLTDITDP